jgi:hypothetical protein
VHKPECTKTKLVSVAEEEIPVIRLPDDPEKSKPWNI